MLEGITDSFRKDVGMTKDQFKDSDAFFESQKIAQNVVDIMQNSSVITDFRYISKSVDTYDNQLLKGPVGKGVIINDFSFQNGYSTFLQSPEFYLLSKGVLKVAEQYPDVGLIGHFHDGAVLAIPRAEVDLVKDLFTEVERIGRDDLKLAYPQTIEVKQSKIKIIDNNLGLGWVIKSC